jgi:hypothetical protein
MVVRSPIIDNHYFDCQFKNPIYPLAFAFTNTVCMKSQFQTKSIMKLPSLLPSLSVLNFTLYSNSCISTTKKPWPYNITKTHDSKKKKVVVSRGRKDKDVPKIAIIGGGLCGVTAAKALVSRMKEKGLEKDIDITIFESDLKFMNDEHLCIKDNGKPKWKAAAARNANSLGECNVEMVVIDCLSFLIIVKR